MKFKQVVEIPEGRKVIYHHVRPEIDELRERKKRAVREGIEPEPITPQEICKLRKMKQATFAGIVDYHTKTIHVGMSKVNQKHKDAYDKEKGRVISLGRAAKNPIVRIPFENEKQVVKRFIETCNEMI